MKNKYLMWLGSCFLALVMNACLEPAVDDDSLGTVVSAE